MVKLVVKQAEKTLFHFETQTTVSIQLLIDQLVGVQNSCAKIQRLQLAIEDLIQYGQYKSPAEHGLTDEQMDSIVSSKNQDTDDNGESTILCMIDGQQYVKRPDPTGRRTGLAPTEEKANTLRQTIDQAKSLIDQTVKGQVFVTGQMLLEQLDLCKAAVTIAYPMQLPDYDPVYEILNDLEDLDKVKDIFQASQTTLWWASKELNPSKILSDYVGKNEKTKLVVKLQKSGQGAPVREPVIDEKAQREMIAYYYKKQEEHKKLAEDYEDSHLQSQWTDGAALKRSFNGLAGDISWKPR